MEGKVKAMCCCGRFTLAINLQCCEGRGLREGEGSEKNGYGRTKTYLETGGGAVGFLEARHSD